MSDDSNPNLKPFLALLVVLIIGVVGYTVYKLGFSDYTVKPDQIFAENFDNSPVQISDLKGGGTKSGNYDVWLTFKLPGRVADLKNKAEFKEGDADQELARRWFAEHLNPTLPSLDKVADWKFFKRVKSETQSISQEWLMYNWKTDEHLYRKYGY